MPESGHGSPLKFPEAFAEATLCFFATDLPPVEINSVTMTAGERRVQENGLTTAAWMTIILATASAAFEDFPLSGTFAMTCKDSSGIP